MEKLRYILTLIVFSAFFAFTLNSKSILFPKKNMPTKPLIIPNETDPGVKRKNKLKDPSIQLKEKIMPDSITIQETPPVNNNPADSNQINSSPIQEERKLNFKHIRKLNLHRNAYISTL